MGRRVFQTLRRSAVRKLVGLQRRWAALRAQWLTRRETPELLKAYEAFRAANQSGSGRQPLKGRDLWSLLERFRPRFIAEMGSGTTSAVFALWALRRGARYVAYEHDQAWARVTEGSLRQAGIVDGLESPIRFVPSRVRGDGQATGFVESIPEDADFVYVDGPPCKIEGGRKVPNDDVVRLFDAGAVPRVVVVDGRVQTVDLIRGHPVGRAYSFEPSYIYCYRRGLWGLALRCREHTVFARADA